MFELVFIVCIDLEAGRRCDQSVIPDFEGRGVCQMAGKVIAGSARTRLDDLGVAGEVGWKCEPQGVGA